MWWTKPSQDTSGPRERPDSTQDLNEIKGTLGSHHKQIDALRATSEQIEAASVDVRVELDKLADQIHNLKLAIAEGIERVERSERRIKATVSRSRKQLAELGYEDPGLDAEAAELRVVDGDGSDERGVSAVPETVAEPTEHASSVPGVSIEQLQMARRLR